MSSKPIKTAAKVTCHLPRAALPQLGRSPQRVPWVVDAPVGLIVLQSPCQFTDTMSWGHKRDHLLIFSHVSSAQILYEDKSKKDGKVQHLNKNSKVYKLGRKDHWLTRRLYTQTQSSRMCLKSSSPASRPAPWNTDPQEMKQIFRWSSFIFSSAGATHQRHLWSSHRCNNHPWHLLRRPTFPTKTLCTQLAMHVAQEPSSFAPIPNQKSEMMDSQVVPVSPSCSADKSSTCQGLCHNANDALNFVRL